MAATLRAAASANLGSSTVSSVTTTFPTGATTGDIVYIVVCQGFFTATNWTAPAGWTLLDGSTGSNNGSFSGHASNVAYKVLQAGDTAPAISWTGAAKAAWVAIAFAPGAGETIAHFAAATPAVVTTASTTFTPPSLDVGGASGVSVVLNASRASVNGATAVTTTPPTSWTAPTNGDTSTAVGTTTATRQVAGSVSYRLAQTGVISPGTETITGGTSGSAVVANLYHLLLTSTAPAAPPRLLTTNAARVRAANF